MAIAHALPGPNILVFSSYSGEGNLTTAEYTQGKQDYNNLGCCGYR